MKRFLLMLIIGIIAGLLDVLPMLKMKLDRFSIASAFLFYLFLPFVILNINLFGLTWWLKGGMIAFLMAIPVIVLVLKTEIQSVIPMAITSIILGTIISIVGHLLKIDTL
jgi:hypothetical protein